MFKKWTKAEEDILKGEYSIDELMTLLPGRTKGAIIKRLEMVTTWDRSVWSEEELLLFPREQVVNSQILAELSDKLPTRHKDQIWRKLKSQGYIWDKGFVAEQTEDNPYPDQGKKWTAEELKAFPEAKEVNAEILAQVQAKLPRRKPSAIWPKMKKEGYIWVKEEESAPKNNGHQPRTSLECYMALADISVLPWDRTPELLAAHRTGTSEDIRKAAEALKEALEFFLG